MVVSQASMNKFWFEDYSLPKECVERLPSDALRQALEHIEDSAHDFSSLEQAWEEGRESLLLWLGCWSGLTSERRIGLATKAIYPILANWEQSVREATAVLDEPAYQQLYKGFLERLDPVSGRYADSKLYKSPTAILGEQSSGLAESYLHLQQDLATATECMLGGLNYLRFVGESYAQMPKVLPLTDSSMSMVKRSELEHILGKLKGILHPSLNWLLRTNMAMQHLSWAALTVPFLLREASKKPQTNRDSRRDVLERLRNSQLRQLVLGDSDS